MPDPADPPRKSEAEQRRERQAAALRENLRRRKEQARAGKEPPDRPRPAPRSEPD